MRVPLLLWSPGMIAAGSTISQNLMNIDLAPTFLELAGLGKPGHMEGASFAPILKGQDIPWREEVYYEYYWEAAFPQTPTLFAVRDQRFKYIYNHGVWDINELYDLHNDPYEINNLIRDTGYRAQGLLLKNKLFKWLKETNGLRIPLKKPIDSRIDHLYKGSY
jgi:arylsulfatase A-like enzyme